MADLHIYLAGTVWFGIAKDQGEYNKLVAHGDPHLIKIAEDVPHRLDSFHYVGKGRKLNELRNCGAKIFLDSGAYSASTLGVEIDIDAYCQFIKENEDLILVDGDTQMCAVLDGIGDPLLTWQNQCYMESKGVRPIPAFHGGEDERYLEYYVANYDYIALGGLVGTSGVQLMKWLDRVWSRYLLDGAGRAKVKVHGFAVTAIPLMERYPWWSVDSTSWIQTASFGAITVPGVGNIEVSKESPSKHVKGAHINSLTPIEYDRLTKRIRSEGFDPDYIVQHYLGRATYNMQAYRTIEDEINGRGLAMPPRPQELF